LKRIVFLLLVLAGSANAQDLATEVKATEAAPGIYLLEGVNGFSSNIGLMVGDEHVLLIDNGMAPITDSLVAKVKELSGRSVDFIVNTHAHGDHVGSNATLANAGATIFAHDNLRDALLEDDSLAGGPDGLPVVTFTDAVTFHANGQKAVVFHLAAAHTAGDAVVHFPESNVIDAGDLFFNELFPFIDIDGGGSVEGFIAGQKRLLSLADDDTVILPGHGGLASKQELQTALDMLIDARERVKKLVDAGKSLEQILEENPLADYHDTWNWAFITTERMTKTLHRSLTDG
jgi:glyoxylase-like metal-dependent hydrolase (beta-lactamase superfamily II)